MSQTQKACSDKSSDKNFGITRIFKHSINELTSQKKALQKNASEKFNNTKSSLLSRKFETCNKYSGGFKKSLASVESKESDKIYHSRENAVKKTSTRSKNAKYEKNFRKSFSENRKEPYKTETLKTKDSTTYEKENQESLCKESANVIIYLGEVSIVQTEDWSFEIRGQVAETAAVDKEEVHKPGCQNTEVQTIKDERKQTIHCADTDFNGNILKTEDWSYELKEEVRSPNEKVIVDVFSEKTSQSEESGKKDVVTDEQADSLNKQTNIKYSTLEDGGINAVGHINDDGQAVVKNIVTIFETEDWSFELKAEHTKTDLDEVKGHDSLRKKNEAIVDTSAALIRTAITNETEANNLNDDRCENKENIDESQDPFFSKTLSDEVVSQYSTANEDLNSQSNIDNWPENKLKTNPDNLHGNSINNDLAVVNFEADLGKIHSDVPVHSTPKKMKDKSQKCVTQSCTEMNGSDVDKEIFRPYTDGDRSTGVENEKCRKDLSVEFLCQKESPTMKNQPEKELMFANMKFKHNTLERKNMPNKSVENCYPITKKRSNWATGPPPRFRNESKYNFERSSSQYDKNDEFHGKAIQKQPIDSKKLMEDGSSLPLLMDLKIKTPEIIKVMREMSSQRQNNINYRECWDFPITEDWTNEIVETTVDNVNKMSEEEWVNLKNCTEEKAVAGNEKYKPGTNDKIIQLESGLREATLKYSHEKTVNLEGKTENVEGVETDTKTSATRAELYLPPPPPDCYFNDDDIAECNVKSNNNVIECVDNWKTLDICKDGILNSDRVVRETQQIRNEMINFSGNSPYLPPIPDEIVDSGDEKSWKEVTLQKSEAVLERIEETCMVKHENDCRGKYDGEATQFNPKQNEKVVVQKDSDSSIYQNDTAYANLSGVENVASEAEVSDLPFDDVKPKAEIYENNSDIGNVSSLKSVGTSYMEIRLDPGHGVNRPGGNSDKLGDTKGKAKETMMQVERQRYEQYARYCYEQYLMNPDSVHGQQNSLWSPNFPYNYETYERWMQHVQYQQYLWQQQFDGQYQMYYDQYYYPYQNYYMRDNAENWKPRSVCHAREKKALKDGYENKLRTNKVENVMVELECSSKNVKIEPTLPENESEKMQYHQNMTGRGLSEYWPERMDQWVENQTPEKSVNSEEKSRSKDNSCKKKLNDESTSFEVIEEESSANDVTDSYKTARDSGILKNNIDLEQDFRQSESSNCNSDARLTCCEINSAESKSKSPCRCKPDDIQFIMWRMCKCEQGNLKLEQVLPCNPDDRSVDFGYLSYESLDQNSSTVRRLEDKKAPGFVIQPLCSTPSQDSKTVKLTVKSETGKQDLSASKNLPHPPPGFQLGVAAAKNAQSRTNSDAIRSEHISDNDHDSSVRNHKLSLLGLIENLDINCSRATPACHRVNSDLRNQNNIQTVTKHSNIEDNRTRIVSKPSLTNLKHSANKISEAMSITDDEDVRNALDLALRVVTREISAMKDTLDMQKANTSDGRKLDDNGNDIRVVNSAPVIDGSHMPCNVNSESASELKYSVVNHPNDNLKRNDLGCEKRKARQDKEMQAKGKESALLNIAIPKLESKNMSALNQSLTTVLTSESIEGYSETSGDENIQFKYPSQSPSEESEAKMLNRGNINNTEMLYNQYRQVDGSSAGTRNKLDKGPLPRDCEMQESDHEGKILDNEILDAGNMDYKEVKRPPMGGVEIVPRPRFPFHARPLFSGLPPPYRGGLPRQPSFMAGYSEFDPADHGFPIPPHPLGWPPPSMMMPTPNSMMRPFDPRYMYGRSVSWDGPSTSYLDLNSDVNRDIGEEIGKSEPSLYQASERDVSMKPPVKMESEDKRQEFLVTKHPRRTSLSLLNEYEDSANDSEPEIEPFDIHNLQNVNQLRKHTPKKLKKDTDGDDTSVDSMDIRIKENNAKLLEESAKATKLSRGQHKKLKQKALKSFSAPDWQKSSVSPTIIESTTKKAVHEHQKRRTLSEIIAETTSGNYQTASGKTTVKDGFEDRMNREFPPLGSEPKNNYPPLPPLPPFPNSPFWAMYTGGCAPSVETKSPDNQFTLANSLALQKARNQWKRYSVSPGQAGSNVFSPSETDSESNSIRSDWKTNFKLFHNFGVKYIDTHCHLDFLFNREGFKGSFKGYMDKHSETFPEQFEGCVAVFCNPASFTPYGGLWLDVAKEPNVWIAMGCHPKMATDFTAAAELGLKKCLRNEKCIALGEIGLDYSGNFQQHEAVQKDVFRRQLKIALDMHKPLVIHCRDAEDDCLEIMKEIVPQKWKIHCHCFTNAYSNAQLWLDAFPNLYIGVTPLVTYRTAKPTHDLARKIPISRLLLETDAPYFIPRCIPKEELPLSNPGLAVTVAKEIAQYQELPVSAVLRQCRLNTKFVYGI